MPFFEYVDVTLYAGRQYIYFQFAFPSPIMCVIFLSAFCDFVTFNRILRKETTLELQLYFIIISVLNDVPRCTLKQLADWFIVSFLAFHVHPSNRTDKKSQFSSSHDFPRINPWWCKSASVSVGLYIYNVGKWSYFLS